jgi:hypothetical protein
MSPLSKWDRQKEEKRMSQAKYAVQGDQATNAKIRVARPTPIKPLEVLVFG